MRSSPVLSALAEGNVSRLSPELKKGNWLSFPPLLSACNVYLSPRFPSGVITSHALVNSEKLVEVGARTMYLGMIYSVGDLLFSKSWLYGLMIVAFCSSFLDDDSWLSNAFFFMARGLDKLSAPAAPIHALRILFNEQILV